MRKKLYNDVKPGVTLTELLVFLWVFSLFTTVVITFLARSTTLCAQFSKKSDALAVVSSAGDWLIRDAHHADTERDSIRAEGDTLEFFNAQEKIVWKRKDGTLTRSVQRFDKQLKEWKKPYTSRVIEQVTSVLFKPLFTKHGEAHVLKGIACEISYALLEKKYTASYTIAFRKGVV